MAVKTVEAKLILAGEDQASRVIAQAEKATRGLAKAFDDVGRSRKATEAVDRMTRALGSQQKALAQVEEVRRRSSARASADMSSKMAVARLDTVTKALGAATAAQKAFDASKAKGAGSAATAEAKRHSDAVRKLTEEQKAAQRELRATQSALRAQDAALASAKTAMKQFGVPVRDLEARERALKSSIEATTDAIRRQEKAARLRGAAEDQRAVKREGRREAIGTIAAGAGMVAAHRGKEIMWESIRNIKAFDDAQKRQVAYTGISEDNQKALIAQAKRIGQETPFSNTDVIKAQTAAMQGLPDFAPKVKAEIAEGILDNVRNYATLMETSLKEGAELVRSYLQTTGKDISTKEKALAEANKAVNQIVMMSKLGGMNGEDAAQYVNYAASAATTAGLPTEAMLAMGALARRGGLRGDVAGVFMRATASKLVAPTNKGRLALKAAGIDFDDYLIKPDKLEVEPFAEEVQRTYGARLTDKEKQGLAKIFSDKKLIGNAPEFTSAVMDYLKESVGSVDAKSAKSVAGLANRYRDSSMKGVDSFRLLQDAMSKNMTLQQINAWLTDKHGGKGAITQRQWDEFKSAFAEIGAAGSDTDFAKRKTDYIMSGVSGALENLHGSWENFTLQVGKANEGLIKSIADATGRVLDMYSQLDEGTQRTVSRVGAGAAVVGGLGGSAYLLAKLAGLGGGGAASVALTGSATHLHASAAALEAAALKLGGASAVTTTATATTAGAAATGAAGAFARWAPMLGMTGFAVGVPWAAAEGNAEVEKKLMHGLERRKAERDGTDLPYLQADATKLRAELGDIAKRTAEIGDDADQAPVVMAMRARKAYLDTALKDVEDKIAERLKTVAPKQGEALGQGVAAGVKQAVPGMRSAIDEGLDALSAVARPTARAIGEKTSEGIADGLKAKAPDVLREGQQILDGVEDIFKAGIGIPIRFVPEGGGSAPGASNSGGGLIRASYGGSATAAIAKPGPTYFGSGGSLNLAPGGESRGDTAPRDPSPGDRGVRRAVALPIGEGTGDGHVASRSERASYIREAARKRGIDPDTALRVAQSEGFDKRIGDGGRSFGDFQLFTGGGLGNDALAAGIDVRDPKKWRDQADFALDHAKKHGWSKFHGAKRVGIGKWQGIEASGGDVTGNVVEMQGRLAGIRRGRITSELRRQLDEAASEVGVRAEVFSGGQPTTGRRKGSHRHDLGGAADVRLSVEDGKGGRRYLSMDDPGDRAAMEAFIRAAVKAGATGVGAGPGYMGPNGIHIGGGKPLAWGAGGKARNAPDWVKRAHRDGLGDRNQSETEKRGAPLALPREAPPKMPEPIPTLPGGQSDMMLAAERMNQAADRFESMRLNTLHTVELTGSGRDGARVKGMKAKSEGPIRADMGVSMPHVRSTRVA